MPTTARRVHYTYAEFLALEEESSVRHEYLDGEIYAVAGGSPDHAALAAAIIAIVGRQLPPGCRVFTSDLRLRVPATGFSTYPDAAVVRGRTLRAEDDPLAVVNPILVVEVTSPSTEEYDRGEKLRHYKGLPPENVEGEPAFRIPCGHPSSAASPNRAARRSGADRG